LVWGSNMAENGNEKRVMVFSLGGSIIVPERVNVAFLRGFGNLVLELSQESKVAIVCGGGKTCRDYINATKRVAKAKQVDLDWVGIVSTWLNAEMLRAIFGDKAYERVIYNPTKPIDTDRKIIIAGGWLPGSSTDKDAVLLAKNLGAGAVVNLSDIEYVYDKDPKRYHDAKKLERLSWDQMRKIVGDKWVAGMNLPFDPEACKEAQAANIRVVIMNGTDLENLKDYLKGAPFKGTVIE